MNFEHPEGRLEVALNPQASEDSVIHSISRAERLLIVISKFDNTENVTLQIRDEEPTFVDDPVSRSP